MIEIPTKPTAKLNVSKIQISLNSAAEFSMQFSVVGWGKYTDGEGNDVWGNTPIVSTLLSVSGAAWTAWGKTPGETDLVQTLGCPVFAALAAFFGGYKIVFYVLQTLSLEVKNVYTIIVKLIDRLNVSDKETNKLAKEIAMLRVEVSSLYKCMGISKKPVKRERDE